MGVSELRSNTTDVFYRAFNGSVVQVTSTGNASVVVPGALFFDVVGSEIVFARSDGIYVTAGSVAPRLLIRAAAVRALAASSALIAYVLDQEILAVPFSGGAPMHVVTPNSAVRRIVVDGTDVYWLDGAFVHVARGVGGAPNNSVVASAVAHPTALRVDHGNVYVSTNTDILRASSHASTWSMIASESAGQIVVDHDEVFWINARDQRLKKFDPSHGVSVLANDVDAVTVTSSDIFYITSSQLHRMTPR
jgi:hypothetical protein